MIVDMGSRVVWVAIDEKTATFAPNGQVELVVEATPAAVGAHRAVVELRQFHGGLAPHVLVGGQFHPGGDSLHLRVLQSAGKPARRTCRSQLRRRKFSPGLPAEHSEAALAGLSRTVVLPSGLVVLDRAGYDLVETSPLITELACELLGRVLTLAGPPTESQVAEWLGALP